MKNRQVSAVSEFTLEDQADTKGIGKIVGSAEVFRLCDYKKQAGHIEIADGILRCEGEAFPLDGIQSSTDIFQLFRSVESRLGGISDDVSLEDFLIAVYRYKNWPIEILDE